MAIKKKEMFQLVRWVMTGVGSFFIYSYLRARIIILFPNEISQLVVGIGLLLVSAYMFNLNKY